MELYVICHPSVPVSGD